MARYSASVEERETMSCFLVRQDMRDYPNRTAYPVVEHQPMGQLAQSESQYAMILADEVAARKMP